MTRNCSHTIPDILYNLCLCLDEEASRTFHYIVLAYYVTAISLVTGLLLWVALEAQEVVRRKDQEPGVRSASQYRGGTHTLDTKEGHEQELDSSYAFLADEVKEISR